MKDIKPALLDANCPCTDLFCLLIEQSAQMSNCIMQPSLEVPQEHISLWNAAQHLEHLLYTSKTGIALTLQALEAPSELQVPMHDLGIELLQRGSFPRRETNAPDFALPRGISIKKLTGSLKRLSSQIEDIAGMASQMDETTTTSAHPILGGFTPRNWLQFIALHQNHHLEISRELLF